MLSTRTLQLIEDLKKSGDAAITAGRHSILKSTLVKRVAKYWMDGESDPQIQQAVEKWFRRLKNGSKADEFAIQALLEAKFPIPSPNQPAIEPKEQEPNPPQNQPAIERKTQKHNPPQNQPSIEPKAQKVIGWKNLQKKYKIQEIIIREAGVGKTVYGGSSSSSSDGIRF